MMRLRLPAIPARSSQPDVPTTRKPAWYNATQEDKENYTTVLDLKLKDDVIPEIMGYTDVHCQCESHTGERDQFFTDILCSVMETSYTCIPLTGRSSKPGQKHPWRKIFSSGTLFSSVLAAKHQAPWTRLCVMSEANILLLSDKPRNLLKQPQPGNW